MENFKQQIHQKLPNLVKLSLLKIALCIIAVFVVILVVVLLLEKHQLNTMKSNVDSVTNSVSHWSQLHAQSKLSPSALNYSTGFIEAMFDESKKRFNLMASQLKYIETENHWKLDIRSGNGQNILRLLERLEQFGLTLVKLELNADSNKKDQVSGSAMLVSLWDWQPPRELTTKTGGG